MPHLEKPNLGSQSDESVSHISMSYDLLHFPYGKDDVCAERTEEDLYSHSPLENSPQGTDVQTEETVS